MICSKMYFYYFVFVILIVFDFTGNCIAEDQEYWRKNVDDELENALNVRHNKGKAKNIILFIGDGMGPNTVAASRIYTAGEGGKLAFEEFPHVGLIKTYSGDHMVPDSASTATSMYSGVKVNSKTGGVDMSVEKGDCIAANNSKSHLETIMKWAQTAEKVTGFVTTTRITHATPMALYAHTADRDWECDSAIPEDCRKYVKDIARQLVEDEPGKYARVIMGGGMQTMNPNYDTEFKEWKYDTWTCNRTDNKNLLDEWVNDKKARRLNHVIATNTKDLYNVNTDEVDYVLGLFSNGHMPYNYERDQSPSGSPSLVNMTEVAIKVLRKYLNGFFLMVESGLIDQANHRGKARKALDETSLFSDAIKMAQSLVDLEETLIIVTADHSHGLSFSGYPKRGSSVLGIAESSKLDGIPYTALNYIVGGPNSYQLFVNGTKVQRKTPNNTEDFEYSQQTGILNDEGVHGGSDVFVYAIGPMSHLFHSLHEQPYIARVMAYAAGLETPFDNLRTSGASSLTTSLLFSCLFYLLFSIIRQL